jgi:hypothetical protein
MSRLPRVCHVGLSAFEHPIGTLSAVEQPTCCFDVRWLPCVCHVVLSASEVPIGWISAFEKPTGSFDVRRLLRVRHVGLSAFELLNVIDWWQGRCGVGWATGDPPAAGRRERTPNICRLPVSGLRIIGPCPRSGHTVPEYQTWGIFLVRWMPV